MTIVRSLYSIVRMITDMFKFFIVYFDFEYEETCFWFNSFWRSISGLFLWGDLKVIKKCSFISKSADFAGSSRIKLLLFYYSAFLFYSKASLHGFWGDFLKRRFASSHESSLYLTIRAQVVAKGLFWIDIV